MFYIPIDIFVILKLLSSICFISKSFLFFNFKRSYLFLAGGGSIESLYQDLMRGREKFCYMVNGAKSWLIVKNSELAESAKKVFDDEVNITLEGRRHLGAVNESKEFKNQYCQEKVDKWLREMESLREISKGQPHAAYVAFTKGFKSKFTY